MYTRTLVLIRALIPPTLSWGHTDPIDVRKPVFDAFFGRSTVFWVGEDFPKKFFPKNFFNIEFFPKGKIHILEKTTGI